MTRVDAPLGSKTFRWLTRFTSSWILLLVFLGAVVRVTGSGLVCPDWPLCSNGVIPPAQAGAWLQVIHRLVAGLAVLLSLVIAGLAWQRYRQHRLVLFPAVGAVGMVLLQAYLGAVSIRTGNQPLVVAGHLAAAATYLALSLVTAVAASLPASAKVGLAGRNSRFFFQSVLLAGLALGVLLMTGATVTGTRAGLACPDWPLCQGEIFPAGAGLSTLINLLHRFSVVAAGAAIASVVLQARRRYLAVPWLARWSTWLGLAFLGQMGLGGLNVLVHFPGLVSAGHLMLALGIWGSLVVIGVRFYLTARSIPLVDDEEIEPQVGVSVRQKAVVYFKLTKPWIMILLLITTLGAAVIAAQGWPGTSLLLYTLLGGALAAGGASTLNSYLDSDIDHVMSRTSRRPTVTGLVTPQETLVFGLVLSTLSFLVYALFVNLLSAILSMVGILYYVFFYTLYLKRSTIHNIIIGGAAGSIPPLVGWTAVTNSLDLTAFYLFAIIFFWTPPHTWALALMVKKDYARARVPMLPVVVGDQETTYQILLYSVLLIALTLLPFAAQVMSTVYLIAAVALGGPFIYLAWQLWRNYDKSTSRRLYKFSQTYLALLFLAMALDRTLF